MAAGQASLADLLLSAAENDQTNADNANTESDNL
jgi:hypothetical protein